MKTKVLIFNHHTGGFERVGNIEVLSLWVQAGRQKALAKVRFFAIFRERNAVHRADIDAGVAFNTFWRVEYGLHVAV